MAIAVENRNSQLNLLPQGLPIRHSVLDKEKIKFYHFTKLEGSPVNLMIDKVEMQNQSYRYSIA